MKSIGCEPPSLCYWNVINLLMIHCALAIYLISTFFLPSCVFFRESECLCLSRGLLLLLFILATSLLKVQLLQGG